MNLFRAYLFNVVFYCFTAIVCILYIPALFLPKGPYRRALEFYFASVHVIEKYVLGLTYEVIGLENLPSSGSYIVGAKHQSAYETMKLYLLFPNPAVILKKELLYLPFWGWLALKSGAIAIDRKTRERAMRSITEGAIRVRDEGRPIAIFPQGTRTSIDETPQIKKYRWGIARMAKAAELDIIPVALNSGVYWPRNAFLKKPGKVTFKILPPISYKLSEKDIMKKLEGSLETESNKLVAEAKKAS
ncbi:MAG: 1-acyl-sn-glycerol-3-phosphate acyltransferase [Micavibrio sp.]|nr:1-acyl-sn-glycerol-3-phosphate acyltransferase [Micavibrio sp.]